MNQDEHKIVVRRMAGLIAAASVLIAVYVLRLIFLQLVNSDSFKAQATNTTDYNFTVTAARGDIVDSAGRRIAASTTSYNVVLSKLLMGTKTLTPCCSASWSCWKPTAKNGTTRCSSASRTRRATTALLRRPTAPATRRLSRP